MSNIKSFTIYEEYYDLITLLDEEEQKELSLGILKYMFEGIEPILSEKAMKVFRNLKRPLDVSRKQSKNKTKKEPDKNQNKTKEEPKENTTMLLMSMLYVIEKEIGVIGEKEKEILEFVEQKEIILTPTDLDRLVFFLDKLSVEEIEDTLLASKGKPFNYAMTILRSKAENLKNRRQSIEPEWFDKPTKPAEPMDEETKKEFEIFLKGDG